MLICFSPAKEQPKRADKVAEMTFIAKNIQTVRYHLFKIEAPSQSSKKPFSNKKEAVDK